MFSWTCTSIQSYYTKLFEFKLHLKTVGSVPHPSDWSIEAEMNQEVLDYVANKVDGNVRSSKRTCMAKIEKWENAIQRHLQNLTTLNQSIYVRVQEDMSALSDVERDVVMWRGNVHDAENKVNELQKTIDAKLHEIDELEWYDEWKAPGLYAVVGAIEVIKVAADEVLEGAQAALTLALQALQASGHVLPDIDPVVIALRLEYAVEHAALVFAQEALKTLGNDVCNVISWIEDKIAELSKLLNIRHLRLSGSAKRLKMHDIASVEFEGIVLGKEFNRTFDMNFASIDNIAGNVYTSIVQSHTSEETVRGAREYITQLRTIHSDR